MRSQARAPRERWGVDRSRLFRRAARKSSLSGVFIRRRRGISIAADEIDLAAGAARKYDTGDLVAVPTQEWPASFSPRSQAEDVGGEGKTGCATGSKDRRESDKARFMHFNQVAAPLP